MTDIAIIDTLGKPAVDRKAFAATATLQSFTMPKVSTRAKDWFPGVGHLQRA